MATIRPNSFTMSGNSTTVRPDNSSVSSTNQATVRPGIGNSTVRPNSSRKTIRPNNLRTSTDFSSTLRPGEDQTVNPGVSSSGTRTGITHNESIVSNRYQPRQAYTLNGKDYKVLQALSLTSGEAQVFLVKSPSGKKNVLKLYYEGAAPNPAILDKVKSVNQTKILFEEISHGKYEDRYYELMPYYEGGTLESVDVQNNESAIVSLIKSMAVSIDFCHQLEFIHRDIKPSNFIFASSGQTNLLLGDFGIAVQCDKKGNCTADMARTKIYAAPEVYLNTGDGKVNITVKSDFYSLGMVIIYLWMGRDNFTHFEKENELQLATQKNYGSFPLPNNMPLRLKSLVKALIVPNPSERAGFKEVEAWLKGDNPFETDNSTSANQSSGKKFKIVFNGDLGLVATSTSELARIMHDNPTLAISYLYKGRLTQWLEDNGRPELAVEMERIKEDLYPRNTTAGLEAACYILNPSIPFEDICGNPCKTKSEIADSILSNFDKYLSECSKSLDNRLIVFLLTHGLESTVIDFRKEFANNPRLGLLYLAYRLDSDQPWCMTDCDGSKLQANTCDEILDLLSRHTLSEQSYSDFVSNAFLIWVKKRNAMAVPDIKPLLTHQGDIKNSEGVLYRLNRKVGYGFILDENSTNYVGDIPTLGRLINWSVMTYLDDNQSNDFFSSIWSELDLISQGETSSLYHFIKSKGSGYDKWIDWIQYCMDFQSIDNKRKAGPYNELIGLFKLIKGMTGGEVTYTFKSGKTISKPAELSGVSTADLNDAKSNQKHPLEAWIAVFYQEDPQLDKSMKYAYEKKVVEYMDFLSQKGFAIPELKRYHEAKEIVESRAAKLSSTLNSIKKGRIFVYLISLLPLAVAATMLAFLWKPNFGQLEFRNVFEPVAIILTIFLCIIDGLAGKVIGEAIWGCVIGAVVSLLIVFLSGLVSPFIPYIAASAVIALGICFYTKCIGRDLKENENSDLIDPQFEHLELEPLHEAYHPTGKDFDSSIGDRTATYQTMLNSIKKSMWLRAVPAGIVTIVAIFYFISIEDEEVGAVTDSEYYNESVAQPEFDVSRGLYGQWAGTLVDEPISATIVKSAGSTNKYEIELYSSTGSEIGSRIIGKFDSSEKRFTVQKFEYLGNKQSITLTASGILELKGDKLIGTIELKNSNKNNGVESLTIPLNIQYVTE